MNSRHFFFYFLLAVASFSFVACGSDQSQDGADGDISVNTEETAAPQVQLTDFPQSPEFSDATISLNHNDGVFSYTIGGNYKLGAQTPDAPQKMCANSAEGQHIHLIIDDQPYIAKYEPSFKQEVPDGDHYILSFLSRSYHESIKTPKAHTAMMATFEGNKIKTSSPIEGPMVFYSRPKGNYVGKAETDKVMLDFYLVNTKLSETGNKLKVRINGAQELILTEWKPYFLEGLPMGDNKVKLTLIGPDGNPLNVKGNGVERTFTLKADPAE